MKKIEEIFTAQQLEVLRNTYFVYEHNPCPFANKSNPTGDTLMIVDPMYEIVLTADDFWRDEDGDFLYYTNSEENQWDYLSRDYMPEEVVKILDAVIDEREAAKKE